MYLAKIYARETMVAEKMSNDMSKVWQGLLADKYKDKEAEVLAALIATLFGKGMITREELDNLQGMLDKRSRSS